MKFRSIAMATVLAAMLVGLSAAPQFMQIAPGYAEEVAASDETVGDSAGGSTLASTCSSDGGDKTGDPSSCGNAGTQAGDLVLLGEGSAEKREVIYASMTASGAVKSLYVVNELFSEIPALVKDFGAYSEVLNLTDEGELVREPDSVLCTIEEGSFVYQGNLASTDLPWKVDIAYRLDGVAVSPEDLAGKSGALTIEIETSQNAAVDPVYFDNYMLQITCALPFDHAKDIVAEDGTIAFSGSDTAVTFTGMPGKSASYKLVATVENFEMEGIQIAALPFSTAIDLPDSDALVAQFDQLIEGTEKLDQGADALRQGSRSLDSGVRAFDQGATKLQTGATELSAGLAAYVAGVAQVSQGLSQAAAGSQAFASKLKELSQASAGIVQGLSTAETQIQALVAKIQASSLPDTEKEALIQQITGLSGQLGGLKEYATGVGALSDGYAQLDSSFGELSAGLTELSTQGDELVGGSTKLDAGVSELAASTESLAQGSDQLASGSEQLSEGTAALHEESKRIPDKVRAEIDALASDYDKSDFVPQSFVDGRNTNVTLVQFVMTTEAIHVPAPEPEEVEEEDETLLSRFFALFS